MLPFTNNPELPETVIQQLDLQGEEVHLANRKVIDSQMRHRLARKTAAALLSSSAAVFNYEFGKVKYYFLAKGTGLVVL